MRNTGGPAGGVDEDWVRGLAAVSTDLTDATAPRACAAAVDVLGPTLTAWAISAAATVQSKLTDARIRGELELTGQEAPALEACVFAMLTGLVTGADFVTPEESVDQVRWAARQGLALDRVLRVIWRAHAGIQDIVIDAMTQAVPGDRLAAEVKRICSGMLQFVATIVEVLSAVFDEESAAWGRHRSATVRRLIDQIVATGEAPAAAAEILGIRLSDNHLAGVLWQAGEDVDPRWNPGIAAWVESVRQRLGASGTLVTPRADGSIEAIWTSTVAPSAAELASLESIPLPHSVSAALGIVLSRPEGLRDSVIAARRLAAVAVRFTQTRVWTFERHGVLALLLADEDACRDFVRRTLAGLLGTDAKTCAVRETLLTYFEHDRSRTASGELLHVAPTTVAYRVRQAQERLGVDIEVVDRVGLLSALMVATYRPDLAT